MFATNELQTPKACLQGHNGTVWMNDPINPTAAQIQVGPFHYFAGNCEYADELLDNFNEYMCVSVTDDTWKAKLEERYKNRINIEIRTMFEHDPDTFDVDKLSKLALSMPSGYSIRPIDLDLIENPEVHSLIPCTGWQYKNAQDFVDRGLGYCIFFDGKGDKRIEDGGVEGDSTESTQEQIVGAVASFNNYDDGIEVDIGVNEAHRQKGLATAVGAKLILHCLEQGLFPHWDAANENSVKLATKLGYKKIGVYDLHIVYRYFEQG